MYRIKFNLRDVNHPEYHVYIGNNKVGIFKKDKNCEVWTDSQDKKPFWRFSIGIKHEQAIEVVHGDGNEHNQEIYALSPGVEGETCSEENDIPIVSSSYAIEYDSQREEKKQKYYRWKNHKTLYTREPFEFISVIVLLNWKRSRL